MLMYGEVVCLQLLATYYCFARIYRYPDYNEIPVSERIICGTTTIKNVLWYGSLRQ